MTATGTYLMRGEQIEMSLIPGIQHEHAFPEPEEESNGPAAAEQVTEMNAEELREWSDRLSRHFEDLVEQRPGELRDEIREHMNRLANLLRESALCKPALAAQARQTIARLAAVPPRDMATGELVWLAKHIERWSAGHPSATRRWSLRALFVHQIESRRRCKSVRRGEHVGAIVGVWLALAIGLVLVRWAWSWGILLMVPAIVVTVPMVVVLMICGAVIGSGFRR